VQQKRVGHDSKDYLRCQVRSNTWKSASTRPSIDDGSGLDLFDEGRRSCKTEILQQLSDRQPKRAKPHVYGRETSRAIEEMKPAEAFLDDSDRV